MRPERLRILIGFLLALTCGLALEHSGLADWADRALIDAEFRFLRRHYLQAVPEDVVVVGIDEETFKTLREPFALWHPHLGRFLRAMAIAEPSVVGFDIVLPDRSFQFLIPEYDRSLLEGLAALKTHAPIALAQSTDENGNLRMIFPPYLSIAGKDTLGSVAVCRDVDQVVRRFDERLCGQGEGSITLAGRMAQHLGITQPWSGVITYQIGAPIHYLPLQQVLGWYDTNQSGALISAFHRKPVLLGVVLPFSDRYKLPVALAAFEPDTYLLPGVLIHAQALRSMLSRGLIATAPAWLVLTILAFAMLVWFGASSWLKAGTFALATLAALAASLVMLWQGFFFPAASVVVVALLALFARAVYDAATQMRERRFLRATFSSYVSPQILQEIISGRIQPGLAGTRRTICVMFCDIRGFTTLSEKLPPEEVISLLNDHFAGATAAICKHQGMVNKFQGDGLLAFFGAPQSLDCAEKNALEAAQDMLVAVLKLNASRNSAGKAPIAIGIGLHSGEVVLGHVGGETQKEYTAIGDVVNVASRLEGLTRQVEHPVVCSATVANAVGRAGILIDLGERALRGHSPLHVFGWTPPVLAEHARFATNPI